jgi:AcrR family transcriptional regulator
MNDPSVPMSATRERIRQIAEEFYVLRGHEGFSFGDIAAAIGTTRANIHHHFGNKRRLMAELADGFAAGAEARIARHWMTPGMRFAERMDAQCSDLRGFYNRFNPEPPARHVWSPISRLRLDLSVLGEPAITALERVNRAYDVSLRHAVAEAAKVGEFRRDIVVGDVADILRITFLSCGPITQDTGSFIEVERLLAALARTLLAAWGPIA